MKLDDIVDETQLSEFIPLTKQGRAIKKAEKAGLADLKQTVKDMEIEFAGILGSQSKKLKTATTDDVISFLQSKNVDTKKIDPTKPMDPKRIQTIFTTLVKDKMGGKNVSGGAAAPAGKPAAPKTQAVSIDAIKSSLGNLKPKQIALLRKKLAAQAGVA